MARFSALLAALALLVAAAGAAPAASYDPALTWRTVATAHFRVHYAEGLEREAAQVAEIAERVHEPMVQALGWRPEAPTEVTLVDRTDLANGYTTILPYNQIVLYLVRPGLITSIGDYAGWLETVFVHEYAHVLSLDPVRGYSKVMRRIFGRGGAIVTPSAVGALSWLATLPPNVLLPPWFHEGLATNLESDLTGRGRRGSTYYDMIYRVDVASGTIPPLDRLGGDFPDWPTWGTRYIYGTRLLEAARATGGEDALRRLVLGHSGRPPFFFNRAPPTDATGLNYRGLYVRMKADLDREFQPQIDQLRREGLTPAADLPATTHSETGPLWLDPDTVVCTRDDQVHPAVLVRKNVRTGAEAVLADRPGGQARPMRLPDGRVAFTRIEVSKPLAGGLLYSDLYSVAPDGWGESRLTHGARVLDADFSAAADAYAAVQARASSQSLVRLHLTEAEPEVSPLLAEEGVRYDTPRWSPDGRWIAFSRKTDKGTSRLALLEVATGAVRLITPEGSQAGFPTWSPDGRRLAFAWDRTRVWDLYALEVGTGELRRLTRLLGGAFEPDWSPDGRRLAFTSYSARGFGVAVLDVGGTLEEPVTPAPEAEALAAAAPTPLPTPASEPYAPYPRALPTFWLPDLTADNQGLAAGAWTSGGDPLYRHLYFLSGYWAWNSDRPYGLGIYRYDGWYPTLTVTGWKLPVIHNDLFETADDDYDYWEEDRAVALEARIDLPRALRHASLAVSYGWEEVARLSRVDDDLDGRRDLAELPFQGKLNPLAVTLTYDSAFPYDNRFTLGAEDGWRLEARYRLRSRELGADLDMQDVVGEVRLYQRLPGLAWPVVALRGKAGRGWGDVPFQSAYQLGGEEGEFPVRGYPPRVARGERALLASGEVRFPLWRPYRGAWDLPVFLGRVHGAAFFDAGRAWTDGGEEEGWRRGGGGELRIDTVLGYYFPTTLAIGYAHGFDDDGQGRGYVTYLSTF